MFWAPTSRARDPAIRPHIDDRAATGCGHAANHGLRAKKLVAQVHVHAVIPVFGFDLILRQTVVIARIVDKGAKRTDGTR
jgi:hypothetical protein